MTGGNGGQLRGTEAPSLSDGCATEGIRNTGWTAHSPRAGHVTAEFLREGEVAIPRLQHECRWQNLKSFKTYLDVVGAAASRQRQFLEKHASVADEALLYVGFELLSALRALGGGSSS